MPLLLLFYALSGLLGWVSAIGPIQYIAAQKSGVEIKFKFSSADPGLSRKLSRLNCLIGNASVNDFIELNNGVSWTGTIENAGQERGLFVYKASTIAHMVDDGRWSLPFSYKIVRELSDKKVVRCRVVQGSYINRPTVSPEMVVSAENIIELYRN
ncbi:hypothetical protein VA599_16615 [Chromobacterium sp. TRC.1.1.SA]|uniref:Uncharacterized protein n=1 Tax=Chromobacterium indicum TaxID=3110228 RepID=A0ABV0CMI6_9NEIS|nr:hypothetical protein [Chromobacterium piscinae]MBX9297297.1 hypothetical protein [Chromobacterium vaccinii]MBX9358194.1 hypothetical protein [Chromobacterium vaccinii]MCD4504484.1 hypothetical protein [Chromobacterium piscinae]